MCKKNLVILLAVFPIFTSCQKDPNWEDMDNEYIVFTHKSEILNIDGYQSFFIPDSILLIGDKEDAVYLKGGNADKIITAVVGNMEKAGYVRIMNKEEADIGMQLSYISSTKYLTGYVSSPYWWWGYPAYWDPFYWGGYWNSWWYGYPISYSYSENSLLGEMVDLKSSDKENAKLSVIWNMYINGSISGYNNYDVNRMVRGVDQAFEQSNYLFKQN